MKYFKLNQRIANIVRNPAERNRLISAAVAEAIGSRLSVPTSEVPNVNEYFAATHRAAVCEIISEINEDVLMDAGEALRLTELTFRFRYNCVWPGLVSPAGSQLDYFCTRARVDQFVSPEEFQWLTANKETIFLLAFAVRQEIDEHVNAAVSSPYVVQDAS